MCKTQKTKDIPLEYPKKKTIWKKLSVNLTGNCELISFAKIEPRHNQEVTVPFRKENGMVR